MLNIQGDLEAAQAMLEQTLALARQIDMKAGIADALVGLGAITVGAVANIRALCRRSKRDWHSIEKWRSLTVSHRP